MNSSIKNLQVERSNQRNNKISNRFNQCVSQTNKVRNSDTVVFLLFS